MEVCSPFGEYQNHVPDFQPSVPKQYIHIFTVLSGKNTEEKPCETFFSDAHPCDGDDDLEQDMSPAENLLDTPLDDAGDDGNDVIKNVKTEGRALDDADPHNEMQQDVNSRNETSCTEPPSHERTQLPADIHATEAPKRDSQLCQAPTQLQAAKALKDLKLTLNPPRKTGAGHKDPKLDPFIRIQMEGMRTMANF
jgi:hypothetical protein